MQWWCSASSAPWTWTPTFYPGVWVVIGLVAFAYWRVSRDPATTRVDRVLGWTGVVLLQAALDWPIGPLAAGYLASAHAVQFLLVAFVIPPLLLRGMRRGLESRAQAWRASAPIAVRLIEQSTQPLLAAVVFNIVVVATHVPAVNDGFMASQLGAFAIDFAWLAGGLWFWWPLLVRVPERPLFVVPMQMLYLFLGSLVHTAIAIVMLVRDHPMYGIYELAPRATPMSALTDLKVAGGIMELGGVGIVFGILTVMFFRWSGGVGAERRP